jgi:hypothetical protein
MNFEKFQCTLNDKYYLIEEDFVGWYLTVYNTKEMKSSSEDYLLDTIEDAMAEAEDRFAIPRSAWEKVHS